MRLDPVWPDLPGISVVAASLPFGTRDVDIVVTVPTFRRPAQLLETLDSIRNQRIDARVAVVVIENEAEAREGAAAASRLIQSGELRGVVIVAHDRGNCCAYNAGWLTALQWFPALRQIAVIDDDEIAADDWLASLSATAEAVRADIVGGPQVPVFPAGTDPNWADHPVFAPPYRNSGLVPALFSSGNLLVSRRVLDVMERPFLDLRFNFMGGGDSDFLSRAVARGFRLAWSSEAIVREAVPARRLEADWIRARSLRNGVISTLVEKKRRAASPLGAGRVVAHSLALAAAAPFRGIQRLVRSRSLSVALYPVYVAAGRLMAEFGYANEQYRQPEKN